MSQTKKRERSSHGSARPDAQKDNQQPQQEPKPSESPSLTVETPSLVILKDTAENVPDVLYRGQVTNNIVSLRGSLDNGPGPPRGDRLVIKKKVPILIKPLSENNEHD